MGCKKQNRTELAANGTVCEDLYFTSYDEERVYQCRAPNDNETGDVCKGDKYFVKGDQSVPMCTAVAAPPPLPPLPASENSEAAIPGAAAAALVRLGAGARTRPGRLGPQAPRHRARPTLAPGPVVFSLLFA